MTDLLYRSTLDERAGALLAWFDSFDHSVLRPDYHRIQIEHWLWSHLRRQPHALVLDVAQHEAPRAWLELAGYKTFGYHGDIIGDLCSIPLDDNSTDAVICTEVLEHCANPHRACSEIHRVLKPGASAYIATPFIWPDHRTDAYPDYWRFTEQGLELMLSAFDEISIQPTLWTEEGQALVDLMRRFECMGFKGDVMLDTGYMTQATKAKTKTPREDE